MSNFDKGIAALEAAARRRRYQREMNREPYWPEVFVSYLGEPIPPNAIQVACTFDVVIERIMALKPKRI